MPGTLGPDSRGQDDREVERDHRRGAPVVVLAVLMVCSLVTVLWLVLGDDNHAGALVLCSALLALAGSVLWSALGRS